MSKDIKWACSINEENYTGEYNTREEAIEVGKAEAKASEQDKFWVAKIKYPKITDYVDANDIKEQLEELLYDNELSFVGDSDIIDVDDEKAFESDLKAVIDQHCSTGYWTVYEVEKINV